MGDLLGTAFIYGLFAVLASVQTYDGEIIQVVKVNIEDTLTRRDESLQNATENIDPTRSAICHPT